jgi:DNA-binding NarL/FixJ family response regulator
VVNPAASARVCNRPEPQPCAVALRNLYGDRRRPTGAAGARGRPRIVRRAGSAAEAAGAALSLAAAVADALGEPAVGTEPAAGTPDNALTQREEEVAARVAEGLTNRQIATRLGAGERTIESHLEHIRRKLGVESRVQVALWAGRHRVPTT